MFGAICHTLLSFSHPPSSSPPPSWLSCPLSKDQQTLVNFLFLSNERFAGHATTVNEPLSKYVSGRLV